MFGDLVVQGYEVYRALDLRSRLSVRFAGLVQIVNSRAQHVLDWASTTTPHPPDDDDDDDYYYCYHFHYRYHTTNHYHYY